MKTLCLVLALLLTHNDITFAEDTHDTQDYDKREAVLIKMWENYLKKRDMHDIAMTKFMNQIATANSLASAAVPVVERAKANPSRENISKMVHALIDVFSLSQTNLDEFHKIEDERNKLYDELDTLLLQTHLHYAEQTVNSLIY